VVIGGSFIHVVSYIPFNLANSFDPIKNDIVSGDIDDIDQLSRRISHFMVEFFDFSFMDIAYAYTHLRDHSIISNEEIPEVIEAMEAYGMQEKSKELEGITRAGKVSLLQKEYHLYILPIRFGDQWIGYVGLLSTKRIGRFFQQFLMEFEDNFLDDQIMLVLRTPKKGY
jgi:hypothetical protein